MSARTPLPPGKEGPRLGGLGGGLVAKAIPGPVRLWERHCPRAHVSWTRVPWSGRASKLGHIQHAGRPWGSREAGNWGPSLNAGQCPPPTPALCVGNGRAQAAGEQSADQRRGAGMVRRERPPCQTSAPGLFGKCRTLDSGVAQRAPGGSAACGGRKQRATLGSGDSVWIPGSLDPWPGGLGEPGLSLEVEEPCQPPWRTPRCCRGALSAS